MKSIFRKGAVVGVVALALAPLTSEAQPYGGWGGMRAPGMMMGPGWGGGRMGNAGMCNPGLAGLGPWRIAEVERTLNLEEGQRKALQELQEASNKAADAMAQACRQERPQTIADRLSFMEARMEAMLAAVKSIRPAFDGFYSSLNDDQKRRLERAVGRPGWGRSR